MNKIYFAVLVLILSSVVAASAQVPKDHLPVITDQEWQPLSSALSVNDWSTASELSARYLARFGTDTLDQAARLRYMYILASAGLVADERLSYRELEGRLTAFLGQRIVLAGRPIATGERVGLGETGASSNSDRVALTMAANAHGTSILCFEYVEFPEPLDLDPHRGEIARMSGVLDRIELNPKQSTIWIMRLFVKDGAIAFPQAP